MKDINGQATYTMESRMQEFMICNGIEEEVMELFNQKKSAKTELLRSIWHETDFGELDRLEEKIFAYGSLLQQKDELERKLFVHMYIVLQQLKQEIQERDSE